MAWGDVYRLQVGEHDHPASGAPGSLGVFRVLGFTPAEGETHRQRAVQGDSYVAVVEFSDPPRARALLSYGNHSQAGSPHVGDQLELLSRQELRPYMAGTVRRGGAGGGGGVVDPALRPGLTPRPKRCRPSGARTGRCEPRKGDGM